MRSVLNLFYMLYLCEKLVSANVESGKLFYWVIGLQQRGTIC